MEKSFFRELKDFVFFPMRAMLPNNELKIQRVLKLTSLADERFNMVLNNCRGLTLDIGCGGNLIIKRYVSSGNRGWGMDIMYNEDIDIVGIVNDIQPFLPFKDESLDTVCFAGSLHHIPNRAHILKEACRILRHDGQILVTMISPFIGWFGHRVLWRFWGDPDQHESGREIEEGEKWGLSF